MDLTDAYDNTAHTPGAAAYPKRWGAASAAFRERMAARADLGLRYGPGARQRFDLFHPEGDAAGLVMFIHGGYWLRFDRSDWSWLAAGPLARGWAVAMPSYTLAPEARISQITLEIATALATAADRVAGPIVVTGHSAGGHLSARMRCRDVNLTGAVADRIARVVPISPLADLRPLMQTAMNAELGLDPAEAVAESPMLARDLRPAETVVWVGGAERPVFLDQARWLAEAWAGTSLTVLSGAHHFDVIDGLATADSQLTEALVG